MSESAHEVQDHRAALSAALERQTAELVAIIESMPDAVYIVNEHGITRCNQIALAQLGFDNREDLNRDIGLLADEIRTRDVLTGEQLTLEQQPFSVALRGRSDVREVAVTHLKTGRETILRCATAPVSLDGEIIGAVAINTDITQRKKVENELQRLNETLEQKVAERTWERDAIWTLSRDLLAIVGPNGYYRSLNPAWQDTFGFPTDVMLATPILDFIHPDDHAGSLAEQAKLKAGIATLHFENRHRHRDGSYRWISWTAAPQGGLFYAVGRDVTAQKDADAAIRRTARRLEAEIAERQRSETSLKESEERHRRLYNRTPMALHSVNADAVLIDVNDHWLQLFGYAREEVLGRSPADFMTDESARLYRDRAWPDMLGSDGSVRTFDYQFVKRSGEIFDGRLSSRGERGADGRFLRTWAATADITAQKQAEAQLLQAQKMEAVGQLTGGIAHDFNNLLTAVIGNLDLLERYIGTDARAKKRAQAARVAADRAAKLTEQLLAFSRKQHLRPQVIDVNSSISRMSDLWSRTIGGMIKMRTDLDPALWPILIDPTQLELVMLNLVINARDSMPLGGAITIETVNLTARKDGIPSEADGVGDCVLVSVTDTGTGMTEDVLGKVFEPFFTTKEVGRGTGLGLSQVYGVVRQSGGVVRIASRLNQGTTVRLYLPRATGVALPDAAEASRTPMAVQDGRILVIDDDQQVREITTEMLRAVGYGVADADSGRSALEALDRGEVFDLIVVDIAMAGLNGVETVRRIRERRPAMRVLFVTGYSDLPTLKLAGDDLLLKKPFAVDALVDAVRQALQRAPVGGTANVVPLRRQPSSDDGV